MQHVFELTDTELEAMTQGENDKDPRLAKMLEWIQDHAPAISDAISETPEALREEIFASLYTDKEAAVERFLSAHPELRGKEEALH